MNGKMQVFTDIEWFLGASRRANADQYAPILTL